MVYYLFATFNISWIRYMLNEKGLQFKLVAVRKCLNAMTRMTWWWIQVQLNVCLFFMESTYGFLFLIMTLILKYLPLFWLGFWLGVRTCSNRLWTFPIVFFFSLKIWLCDAKWDWVMPHDIYFLKLIKKLLMSAKISHRRCSNA